MKEGRKEERKEGRKEGLRKEGRIVAVIPDPRAARSLR